jgi:peptidoglycan/LPS O-acetylase OafA/YrhL
MTATVPPGVLPPHSPATAPVPDPTAVPAEPPPPRVSTRFTFIDALRGIAALGVACYHITRYGPLPELAEPAIPQIVGEWFSRGWTGVQMFFVISGFVIAYTLRDARVTPAYVLHYAFRRSLRLDPPYWGTIAFVLALHAVMALHLGFISPLDVPTVTPLSWPVLISHLFYLQNILGYENISAGFWTLCIEVQFYLLYVVGYGIAQRVPSRSKRTSADAGPAGLLLVFAPAAAMSLFVWNLQPNNDMWISHFYCMFFLGMAAWWALDGRVPGWVFWGYAFLVGARLRWVPSLDLSVALLAGALIYFLGRAGRLGTTLNWRWLQYLGRISYSLYLIHFPIAHVVTTIGYELGGRSMPAGLAALWLLLALAASLGAAHLLYRLVEAPSVRFAARFKRA